LRLPEEWIRKAEVFLDDAKSHLNKGNYWLACFEAQQATELYLKALLVGLTGLHPFTHDLVELIDSLKDLGLKIPENLYVYADALTPHYTLARYPGRKPVRYDKRLAERCLFYAEKIIKWVEKEASQKLS